LHYGSGVWEGIRAYPTANGMAIFRLDEHVARLLYSAEAFGMKISQTTAEIKAAILRTVALNTEANPEQGVYIRPIFYYGENMSLPPGDTEIHFAVTTFPFNYLSAGKPTSLGISSIRRPDPRTTVVGAKIGGFYANAILASNGAKSRGFDEALMLDVKGRVAEGPGANIFLVRNGRISTPQAGHILLGITRASIIEIANLELNKPVRERRLRSGKFRRANEVFLTGTAAEVKAVGSIDGKVIGNGEIGETTQQLREIYLDIVHGRGDYCRGAKLYREWLTPVPQAA